MTTKPDLRKARQSFKKVVRLINRITTNYAKSKPLAQLEPKPVEGATNHYK